MFFLRGTLKLQKHVFLCMSPTKSGEKYRIYLWFAMFSFLGWPMKKSQKSLFAFKFTMFFVRCPLSSNFFLDNGRILPVGHPFSKMAQENLWDDLEVGKYQQLDHLPRSIQRRKVDLTLETQWSKLCDEWGMVSAVKCRSMVLGTFCNQALFLRGVKEIPESLCPEFTCARSPVDWNSAQGME